MESTSKYIGVVGGGIGGLTAGLALRQKGFKVAVFEQAEAVGEAGAGIVLGANAMRVFQALDVQGELHAEGREVAFTEIQTSRGLVLSKIDVRAAALPLGLSSLAIHRARLHEVLLRKAKETGVEVYPGQRLESLDRHAKGALLCFASGREEDVQIVVGADGIHSRVRAQLFGTPALRDSGQFCWRGVIASDRVAGNFDREIAREMLGRGARFGIVPIGHNQLYWYATAPKASLSAGSEDPKAFLRFLFRDWHFSVGRLVEATPVDRIIALPIKDAAPIRGWHRHSCVLLGDAIHPTTPNMGQGAGMAIESAFVLADCLERHATQTDAFEAYEKSRAPRTRMITERSNSLGKLNQTKNPFVISLRNFLYRGVPAGMQRRAIADLFAGNPVDRKSK